MSDDFDTPDETTDSGKYRSWIFTVNNYTEEQCTAVQMIECVYLVYGREVAPSTGTRHLQGYVMFKNPVRHKFVRELITGKPWVRNAKADATKNRAYCTKGGDFYEKGVLPKKGKRTDMEHAKDIIMAGGNMRQVITEVGTYQSTRMADIALQYFEQVRDWETEVYWYYGSTGAGKTLGAFRFLESLGADRADIHFQNLANWWNGYDGHEYVILDEFRDDDYSFREILGLLGGHAHRISIKGTVRQFRPRVVVITAPHDPTHYYDYVQEDRMQFFRRIKDIKYFEPNPTVIPEWFKKLMASKNKILA